MEISISRPSIFASGEEAAEHLLIALFAWIALTYLPSGKLQRSLSAALGNPHRCRPVRRRKARRYCRRGPRARRRGPAADRVRTGRRSHRITMTKGRTGLVLILGAIGSMALISFLGASKIVPFLTSKSNAQTALTVMFSPINPGSLAGQGTGTSAAGANVLGATAFTEYRNYQEYGGYLVGGGLSSPPREASPRPGSNSGSLVLSSTERSFSRHSAPLSAPCAS